MKHTRVIICFVCLSLVILVDAAVIKPIGSRVAQLSRFKQDIILKVHGVIQEIDYEEYNELEVFFETKLDENLELTDWEKKYEEDKESTLAELDWILTEESGKQKKLDIAGQIAVVVILIYGFGLFGLLKSKFNSGSEEKRRRTT